MFDFLWCWSQYLETYILFREISDFRIANVGSNGFMSM